MPCPELRQRPPRFAGADGRIERLPLLGHAYRTAPGTQTNPCAVKFQRIRRALPLGEQKANIMLDVPPELSDGHDRFYGSVRSLERVRCIEAAVT